MTDDWKGEHFIRGKVDEDERYRENRRVVSTAYHKKRRAAGEPAPSSKMHTRFLRRVFADLSKP